MAWAFRALTLAWLVCVGCTTRRASQWDGATPPVSPPSPAPVALIALGNIDNASSASRWTADQLERVLAAEHRAGRHPILLWTGNTLREGHKPCAEAQTERPRAKAVPLRSVLDQAHARGLRGFAVPGPLEWHCGRPDAEPGPWAARPGPQFTVAVDPTGTPRVATVCDPSGCTHLSTPTETDLFELVFADFSPWLVPHPRGASRLEALAHLLQALAQTPRPPPRLLVSHVPVEAAGTHGLGGWQPDSSFHMLPPPLRTAFEDGMFVGVIAGRDHATYADPDLGPAVARGDKVWLPAPVFEVVSGAAARPDIRRGRVFRYGTSITLLPEIYSHWTGFAVVHIGRAAAHATVYSRHWGRWQAATLPVAMHPQPHPRERAMPSMAPCLRCPAVPASFRE